MTDTFEKRRIDMPSDTSVAGRYDKLHEAGMATRFVRGASGNPSGRPKRTQSRMRIKDLAERFCERSGRA
jgi:hypothetical protein